MKRLLFRMSALAGLLVLVFFAIAHAQRGPGSAPPQEATDQERTDSGGAVSNEPNVPPRDVARGSNPLRAGQIPLGIERDGVRMTAAASDDATGPQVVKADGSEAVGPPRAVDPFTLGTPTRAPVRRSAVGPGKMAVVADSDVSAGDGTGAPAAPTLAPPNRFSAPSPNRFEPPAGARPAVAAVGTSPAGVPASDPANRALDDLPPPAPVGEPALLRAESRPGEVNRRGSRGAPASPSAELASPGRLEEPAPRHDSHDKEGGGKPGGPRLEGPQVPQLTIQKIAPPEVQVGKLATFSTTLRNTGRVVAHNVEIRDEVPKGARLVNTNPRASRGPRGELIWPLGTVKPGDEVSVEMQLMPTEEGEMGSVATVSSTTDASARTTVTRPQLMVKTTGPNRALLGEQVVLVILISNPGTGTAHKVVLEERIPPGLRHPAGRDLEYEVGDLRPNETRRLELKMTAAQAGMVNNVLSARADANLKVEDRFDLEVLAPKLVVNMEGSKRRFLERQATYTVSVSNPGTAPARQVELIAQLPPGLKFVEANNAGHYQEATRTVHWLLEELPVKETGSVSLTTMPIEPGEQTLRIRGVAQQGLTAIKEHPVLIEGVASLAFEVTSLNNPIEVRSETTYEIRLANHGSKAATNVRISALLPPEMKFVSADGPTRQFGEGNRIVFEPLPRMAPKATAVYRLRAKGLRPGDLRVRFQVTTDDMQGPVTKEESTRVFSEE